MKLVVATVIVEFPIDPAVTLKAAGVKEMVGEFDSNGVTVADRDAVAVRPVLVRTTRVLADEPATMATGV